MKINGSLSFDASGLSVIENLRVQRVSDAARPAWQPSDKGRLIFSTTTGILLLGSNSAWVPLTNGKPIDGSEEISLEEIETQLNNLKASLGVLVNIDGSFNSSIAFESLVNSTSVTDILQKLDTALTNRAMLLDGGNF